MEPVRGHRNKRVVEASRLHRARVRKETGLTLIEGPHLVEEALRASVGIVDLFALPDDTHAESLAQTGGIDLTIVDDAGLKRLSDTVTPRGPVAVAAIPPDGTIAGSNTVVCWSVSDPGNVGTIIRTAAAFGWSFAHTKGTADPWSPKVLRSGAGNQFHLPVRRIDGLVDLREAGLKTIASIVNGGMALGEVGIGPFALLIGEEAPGLPEDITVEADATVTVPMPGEVESLNASVAAGILIYELSKHSGKAGPPV